MSCSAVFKFFHLSWSIIITVFSSTRTCFSIMPEISDCRFLNWFKPFSIWSFTFCSQHSPEPFLGALQAASLHSPVGHDFSPFAPIWGCPQALGLFGLQVESHLPSQEHWLISPEISSDNFFMISDFFSAATANFKTQSVRSLFVKVGPKTLPRSSVSIGAETGSPLESKL